MSNWIKIWKSYYPDPESQEENMISGWSTVLTMDWLMYKTPSGLEPVNSDAKIWEKIIKFKDRFNKLI